MNLASTKGAQSGSGAGALGRSGSSTHGQLEKNALGVAGVVFLVLAAVAPLTGIVVVAALAIALGNGGGAAASFIIVAIILLFFAVGYAQMSKQLVNAGGFYAFVVKGLGRSGGLVAGLIATMGYNFFVAGTIGCGDAEPLPGAGAAPGLRRRCAAGPPGSGRRRRPPPQAQKGSRCPEPPAPPGPSGHGQRRPRR